jgi:hypothetical protein
MALVDPKRTEDDLKQRYGIESKELDIEMQKLASSQQERRANLAPTVGPSAELMNALLAVGFTSKSAKALSSDSSIAPLE